MPATVYKGDLTEVSFGHETGLKLPHNYAGSFLFKHLSTNAKANTSIINFSGGAPSTPCNDGKLAFPVGMLVGCRLSIIGGGAFSADDSADTGRTYSIMAHKNHSTNDTELTVTPALKTAAAPTSSTAGDVIFIHTFGTPTMDVNMGGWHITAASSSERVLTDQFVGLAATISLPETKVDLKRYHVVGLGRDVAVQVPGRFLNEGGSFEVNLHNSRWLYYALGMESVAVSTQFDSIMVTDRGLGAATEIGETFITLDGAISTFNLPGVVDGVSAMTNVGSGYTAANGVATTGGSGTGLTVDTTDTDSDGTINSVAIAVGGTGYKIGETITVTGDGTNATFTVANTTGDLAVAAGDYIFIKDETVTDVISYDAGGDLGAGAAFGASTVGGEDYFNQTQTNEIRRIAGISTNKIWLDDGLCFPHAINAAVRFIRFDADGTGLTGSPHRASTGALTRGVTRCIYSRTSVPSFAMEVSIRRRDAEGSVSDVTDDGASDTKQLTRVYKGCKVKDFSITADTDAALRMSVNFDSALCYTDTGRLETAAVSNYSTGSKGDRYKAHRMFEETGGTLAGRKEVGIEKGTQKPYMFYNGTVSIAGVTLGQIVSFTITGNTGVQQFYTINGAATTDSATDQIPFGGSRNASLAVEGKTEYSMDCEIIVDDPVFYHKVRRAIGHDATTGNMIRLTFTKPGTAGDEDAHHHGREGIDILLDDFVITEAPLPIPEDKGVIKAPLKIMPKSMRVVATDTLLHS
tara:strand:+ start:2437 stop:4680 length:2244 start_codon:yes stop_codon:yes gene_type:complete